MAEVGRISLKQVLHLDTHVNLKPTALAECLRDDADEDEKIVSYQIVVDFTCKVIFISQFCKIIITFYFLLPFFLYFIHFLCKTPPSSHNLYFICRFFENDANALDRFVYTFVRTS